MHAFRSLPKAIRLWWSNLHAGSSIWTFHCILLAEQTTSYTVAMGRIVMLVVIAVLSVGLTTASDCDLIRSCNMKMGAMRKIGPDNTCTPEVRAEMMEVSRCIKEMLKDSMNTESCPRLSVPQKYRSLYRNVYESSFRLVCTGCPVSTAFMTCYGQNGRGQQCDPETAESLLDQQAACVVGRLENEPLCEDHMENVDLVNAAYKEMSLVSQADFCAAKGKARKKRSAPTSRLWPFPTTYH